MRRSKRTSKSAVDHAGNVGQPRQPQQKPVEAQPNFVQSSIESHAVGSLPSQPQVSIAIMTRSRRASKTLVDHASQSGQSNQRHDGAQINSGQDQLPLSHQLPTPVQPTSIDHNVADDPPPGYEGIEQATRHGRGTSKALVDNVEDNLSQPWQPQEILGEAQPSTCQAQPQVTPQIPRQCQLSPIVSHAIDSQPSQPWGYTEFVPAIMTRRKQARKSIMNHVNQPWQSQTQVRSGQDQPLFSHQIPREAQATCIEPHLVDCHPSEAHGSGAIAKCSRPADRSVDDMGDTIDKLSQPQETPIEKQSSSDQRSQQLSRHQMPRQSQPNSFEQHEVDSYHANQQGSTSLLCATTEFGRETSKSLIDHERENLNQHQQPQGRLSEEQNFGETLAQHQLCRQVESSSATPHEVNPNPSRPEGSSDSTDLQPRGRGPTRCDDVWNNSKRLHVEFNKNGQPIGRWARKLSSFLGTLARNGHIIPLTHHDWRSVPQTAKKNAWQLVLSKFELDISKRKAIMESMACKWRNWKSQLRSIYYSHASDDWILERDDRIVEEQWRALINYWNSDEGKKRSMTNKANRAKVKRSHTSGSRSFAQICEIERKKMPDGEEPSRAKIFIVTHTRKDGQAVDETSATVISQLNELMSQQPENELDPSARDDIYSRIIGPEKKDQARTYGACIKDSDLSGRPGLEEELKRVLEAKQSADEEIRKMRDKIVAMEQEQHLMKENQQRMELKYASLQSQVDMLVGAMVRNNPNVHLTDIVGASQGVFAPPFSSNNQHRNKKRQRHEA